MAQLEQRPWGEDEPGIERKKASAAVRVSESVTLEQCPRTAFLTRARWCWCLWSRDHTWTTADVEPHKGLSGVQLYSIWWNVIGGFQANRRQDQTLFSSIATRRADLSGIHCHLELHLFSFLLCSSNDLFQFSTLPFHFLTNISTVSSRHPWPPTPWVQPVTTFPTPLCLSESLAGPEHTISTALFKARKECWCLPVLHCCSQGVTPIPSHKVPDH